jgi:DNA-binding PadR family transcriptional regulator
VCLNPSKTKERRKAVEKTDILLLVLNDAEESLTPVQLQKSLFLIGDLMSKDVGDNFYHFEPYHYGPFNGYIYDDLKTEAANGFVSIAVVHGQRWSCYSITHKGRERVIQMQTSEKFRKNVKKIVNWVQGMTFEKLVATIYKQYPEFKKNSIFYG